MARRERVREYRVSWDIELEASSSRRAAEMALEIQRDPDSTAVAFEVYRIRKRRDGSYVDEEPVPVDLLRYRKKRRKVKSSRPGPSLQLQPQAAPEIPRRRLEAVVMMPYLEAQGIDPEAVNDFMDWMESHEDDQGKPLYPMAFGEGAAIVLDRDEVIGLIDAVPRGRRPRLYDIREALARIEPGTYLLVGADNLPKL